MVSGLVTPNFSPDSLGRHTDYIEQLSRKHATLSKLVLEDPHREPDEDRILAFRERIQEAWSRAEGNPASGKWVRITQLLRMGVTSGRGAKWVGARADIKSPECPAGWVSTMSESDWNEWEQKFIQDQRLKNMVETWKKGVEVTDPPSTTIASKDSPRPGSLQIQSGALDKQNPKSGPTTPIGPLKDSAPFGFGVVKRTSRANVLNGKSNASGDKMAHERPHLPTVAAPGLPKEVDKPSFRRPKEPITSGVELSSMHPSFSGPQLYTSTPKQTAKPKTSLVAQSEVSSPLTPLVTSPSKATLLGRASSLSSPPGHSNPVMPSLEPPLRHTTSQPSDAHDLLNTNNKRTLSSSHSYPIAEADSRISKRLKTIPSKPTPQTPPRAQQDPASVPTLTELLASVKRAKKKRPQRKEFDHKQHSTSEQAQASGDGKEIPPFFDPFPVDDGGGNIQELDGHPAENPHQEYDFYSRLNDRNLDIASPAKSQSQIIGASGGEEDEVVGVIDEFVLDSSFRPVATSTQVEAHERHRGLSKFNLNKPITQPDIPPPPVGNATDSWESIYAPRHGDDAFPKLSATSTVDNKNNDSSFPPLSYNTQFESAVAAQVEKVNKLLQRDVDYGGLSNNTPFEDQERDEELDDSGNSLGGSGQSGSVKEGRNGGYSYGYGKAFEYDQSF